jgi:hypothetical protein
MRNIIIPTVFISFSLTTFGQLKVDPLDHVGISIGTY